MSSIEIRQRTPQSVISVRQTVPIAKIDLTREPDPSSWPPADQWRTELVQPIK